MKLFSCFALVVPLLAASGCDRGSEAPTVAGEGPAAARETPVRKAVEVATVAWPSRASIDQATRVRFKAADLALIDRSPTPVLAPTVAALLERPVVVVKPAFYSLSLPGTGELEGVQVVVSATRVSHRYANVPALRREANPSSPGQVRVRGGQSALVTQNEGIWSVTFEQFGVSYLLEVECSRAAEDARCGDARLVLELTEQLGLVGGSFADGEVAP